MDRYRQRNQVSNQQRRFGRHQLQNTTGQKKGQGVPKRQQFYQHDLFPMRKTEFRLPT
jgi:hypothetical protein